MNSCAPLWQDWHPFDRVIIPASYLPCLLDFSLEPANYLFLPLRASPDYLDDQISIELSSPCSSFNARLSSLQSFSRRDDLRNNYVVDHLRFKGDKVL